MSADLAQFIDGILRSFGLIAYAVALSGPVFVAVVLKPWRAAAPNAAAASGLRLKPGERARGRSEIGAG